MVDMLPNQTNHDGRLLQVHRMGDHPTNERTSVSNIFKNIRNKVFYTYLLSLSKILFNINLLFTNILFALNINMLYINQYIFMYVCKDNSK